MSTPKQRRQREESSALLVAPLVSIFNGAIKYAPMMQDHGPGSTDPWDEAKCLAFAREWHAVAITQLRFALERQAQGWGKWNCQSPPWNNRIPYCRNEPTEQMMLEALSQ